MQKKIIILTVSLLAIGAGVLYWQKGRSGNIVKISPTSRPMPSQSENETIGLPDVVTKITRIDYQRKIIKGTTIGGHRDGMETTFNLKDVNIFYDKNDNIVPLSYFKIGMIVAGRGYIYAKEPDIIYPDGGFGEVNPHPRER